MPFIPPNQRDAIKLRGIEACETVGDVCYVFYCHLMTAWNEEKRWRTAHRLYDLECDPADNEYFQLVYSKLEKKFELKDVAKASALAYKVWFQLHVMPYEIEMINKNGNIL